MMRMAAACVAAGAVALMMLPAAPQSAKRGPRSGIFHAEVPAHPFDVILTRPGARAVTASILAYEDMDGCLEYGTKPGIYTNHTSMYRFRKGEPVAVELESLQLDTRYYYRFRSAGITGPEWTFHTQRRRGVPFTFAVEADSHLDENADPEIYRITLANALAAQPDFYVDLGDTFMTEKRRGDFRQALAQYLAQRYYFGLICHSAPLLLVLGNHDGEGGSRFDGSPQSMAAWSLQTRKRYFPNPLNGKSDAVLGPLENYYAWEWGGALFVVLDPYWPTTSRGREDNWNWTLGLEQYRWLKKTLEESKAGLRFVFIHHPVGGNGQPVRGGVEAAKYNEWGGRNPDGSNGFREHRPGWDMPIHELLEKNRVSVVFHGHDHFFAREEMDGVIYQLVPQPGNPRTGAPRNAREYGYVHGDVLGGAGYVRVKVEGEKATVDYVLSALRGNNAAVAFSYTVSASRQAPVPDRRAERNMPGSAGHPSIFRPRGALPAPWPVS